MISFHNRRHFSLVYKCISIILLLLLDLFHLYSDMHNQIDQFLAKILHRKDIVTRQCEKIDLSDKLVYFNIKAIKSALCEIDKCKWFCPHNRCHVVITYMYNVIWIYLPLTAIYILRSAISIGLILMILLQLKLLFIHLTIHI